MRVYHPLVCCIYFFSPTPDVVWWIKERDNNHKWQVTRRSRHVSQFSYQIRTQNRNKQSPQCVWRISEATCTTAAVHRRLTKTARKPDGTARLVGLFKADVSICDSSAVITCRMMAIPGPTWQLNRMKGSRTCRTVQLPPLIQEYRDLLLPQTPLWHLN